MVKASGISESRESMVPVSGWVQSSRLGNRISSTAARDPVPESRESAVILVRSRWYFAGVQCPEVPMNRELDSPESLIQESCSGATGAEGGSAASAVPDDLHALREVVE